VAEADTFVDFFGEEEEEVLGDPIFEITVRHGQPIVAGSYFMFPPLRQVSARLDPSRPGRLVVTTTDGREWFADDVPTEGVVNVRLRDASEPGQGSEDPDGQLPRT
jgi:hypothetical protein